MNMEHVEVLRDLSEVCRAAIKAGDWKVDGACDPDSLLRHADAAIASLSAQQPPAEAQPVDDPGEFGVGIQPNPKARYWQERAEFWRAQAVALGWREKRDTENGEAPPPSAPVGVDTIRDGRAIVDEFLQCASIGRPHGKLIAQAKDWLADAEAALTKQPAAVDGGVSYPTPRNRQEASALAGLALAYLGVTRAHIDAVIARCETDLAAQQGGGK